MARVVRFMQMFIRLDGLALLILGVLIWTGNGGTLISAHAALGGLLVLALWVLAGVGARAGISWALVVRAVVWGIVALLFGILHPRMMVGPMHWVIQSAHLVIGLITIGVGEIIGAAIRRRTAGPQGLVQASG